MLEVSVSTGGDQGTDGCASSAVTERRFQTMVEHIPMVATYVDLVQDTDAEDLIPVYISPQIEGMLGYPCGDWMADSGLWLRVVHPDDRERMLRESVRARRTLGALNEEYRLVARDGHVVWVCETSSAVTDTITGDVYWQGVMVDITASKQTQAALEASERRFKSLFEAAAIGVVTLRLDGRIDEANGMLERVGGYDPGALNGRPLADFLDPEDTSVLELCAELSSGARDRGELEHRFLCDDGSLIWSRTVLMLVRDAAGAPAHVIGMLEDISARKREEEELVYRALHDGLTGLPNREHFLERLRVAVARTDRPDASGTAVIFLDLDGFKRVNDGFGHEAGDALLVVVAERLREGLRPRDTAARFAGDEFVVIAESVSSLDQARDLAIRLGHSIEEPFLIDGQHVEITVSIGVAMTNEVDAYAEDIVRGADAAMYEAKADGQNRVVVGDVVQRS
jgi:diguanylate cyclase (GGDEF)-like protein/PAS domain S-box-containing protein